jgi:DNA-binding CsgD family transcriptional regulator
LRGPIAAPSILITPREREILTLVADGLTSSEIGMMLGISERTVEWHLLRVVDRIGARNRVQAVVLAIRDGLITAA